MFTLSFILSKRGNDLGDIFKIGVAYWAALPVSTNQITASEKNFNFIRASLVTKKNYFGAVLDTQTAGPKKGNFLLRKEQQFCFSKYRKIYILEQLQRLSCCNNATAAQLYSSKNVFYFENPSIRFLSHFNSVLRPDLLLVVVILR